MNNYHILAQHSVNGEELIDAFKRLDTNGDGYLNLPELKVHGGMTTSFITHDGV